MSYRPWRDEQIELLDINAEAIVKEHQLEIANAYQEFNQLEDDQLEAFMRQLMQDRNDEKDQGRGRGNGDRVANEDDFGRYTTEIDDSEEGDYQQNADITEDLNPRAIQPRATYFEKIKVAGKTPDDEYYELLARPNTKQRLFLTHVMHHVRNNKDDIFVRYFDSSVVPPSNNTFSPMHLLVTGVAGTGKNEISMFSCKDFGRIDKRLRHIFDPDKPFGGKPVICFGGFNELSPVHANPVYSKNSGSRTSNSSPTGALLQFDIWSFFKPLGLTQIMDQSGDLEYAIALNNMATGTMTEHYIGLLQSRVYNVSPEQTREIQHYTRFEVPADVNSGVKPMIIHTVKRT